MVWFNFTCICNSSEFTQVLINNVWLLLPSYGVFCSSCQWTVAMFTSLCAWIYVQGYRVFHNAKKYEFQYTDTASSRKMEVGPTDTVRKCWSFSSLQILMTANSRTQIQATVLMRTVTPCGWTFIIILQLWQNFWSHNTNCVMIIKINRK
jgi:uncharacterized membrane protein